MNIFKTLQQKPWIAETAAGTAAGDFDTPDTADAARTALRFVLAVVGVLFFLFSWCFGGHTIARTELPSWATEHTSQLSKPEKQK